jgi:hypothetical protein
MAADRAPEPDRVRPSVALWLTTAGFVALLIFGLGMTSLALDEDVIAVPGLGQIPGVIGTVLATGAFCATLAIALRHRHPSYWTAAIAAVVVGLAFPLGVWIGAVAGGADLAAAAGAAGGLLTSWFGVVTAAVAFVCAWAGVALIRTRAQRPRWPWEDADDA